MEERLISAGFGGQGVLATGMLTAYAGMVEGREVSWVPSYGPEMRGGTANCSVTVSDDPVGSPIITNPTSVIVMNLPSLNKYEPMIEKGGKIFVNSSLVDEKVKRDDIDAFYIPAEEIAAEIGAKKTANLVMLGAFLEATNCVKKDTIIDEAFDAVFRSKLTPEMRKLDEEAIKRGAEEAKKQL